MSKTPYEIRLDLLKLSKENLTEIAYSKRQALTDEFHAKFENDSHNAKFPDLPDLPSTNDIITEAEKLNTFVTENKSDRKVFYIDIGDMPKEKAAEYIEEVQKKFKTT